MFAERNFTDVHQDLNIPVPDPITINHVETSNDDDQPSAKRPRVDYFIPGTKVMALPTGTVPCNKPLCDMIKIVKPIIRTLVEDCK